MNGSNPKIAFFGGEPLGVPALEAFAAAGLTPKLVVCNPDRPAGRGQRLSPPPVKVWAEAHGVAVWQPTDLKDQSAATPILAPYDLFVVVAYNHILPEWLITLPPHQTLNLHPSLLPKYRGCNPIRAAILADDREHIGVTIMQLDTKMDHGPIVAQVPVAIDESEWPLQGTVLDQRLAKIGGELLATTIPAWLRGEITPIAQNHTAATYTKKMSKGDGELSIDPFKLPHGRAAYEAVLKIRAYDGFPGTFFIYNETRVKINKAELVGDQLRLIEVTPEGRKPIDFLAWLQQQSK